MKISRNIILLALINIFAFSSCQQGNKKQDDTAKKEELSSFYFSYYKELKNVLGVVRWGDTLTITIHFSDCGEWGGHQEKIILFNNDNQVNARFVADTVNCDEDVVSKGNYAGVDNNITKVLIDSVKVLNITEEKMMNFFICRVFELYLDNFITYWDASKDANEICVYSDSGKSINIENSDGSFILQYRNIDELTQTYYGVIRKKIFGDFIH